MAPASCWMTCFTLPMASSSGGLIHMLNWSPAGPSLGCSPSGHSPRCSLTGCPGPSADPWLGRSHDGFGLCCSLMVCLRSLAGLSCVGALSRPSVGPSWGRSNGGASAGPPAPCWGRSCGSSASPSVACWGCSHGSSVGPFYACGGPCLNLEGFVNGCVASVAEWVSQLDIELPMP